MPGESADMRADAGTGKMTDRERQTKKRSVRAILLRSAGKYLILAALVLLVNQYFVTIRVVHGEDMYPRLRDGDLLVVLRGKRARRSGEVVVYRKDGRSYTGRIAAAGSDQVSFSQDGELLVNGSPVWQDVFFPTAAAEGEDTSPLILEEDACFILADRRTDATDSRQLGPVYEDEIVGQVLWVLRHRGI